MAPVVSRVPSAIATLDDHVGMGGARRGAGGGQGPRRRETRSRGVGESPLVNKADIEASIESGSGSGEGDVDGSRP
jgi:hypothetical protein